MSGVLVAGGLAVLGHVTLLPGANEIVPMGCKHCGVDHAVRAFSDDPRYDAEVPRTLGRRIDRFSALAVTVVSHLVRSFPAADPERLGVFVLNSSAGWAYGEEQLETLVTRGVRSMQPYQATAWFPAAAQGEVTIRHGILGEAKSVAGYSGGLGQVWWAAQDAIEAGAVDRAVVVVAESRVSSFSMLASSPCRDTGGPPVLAEGAVAVLIEATAAHTGSPMSVVWRRPHDDDSGDPLALAGRLGSALDDSPGSCPIELGDGYALVPMSGGSAREAA